MSTQYRDYTISHDPKPIPDRSHDWDFAHDDFDGAPDSYDPRCGTAASLEEAKQRIDEIILEEDEPSEEYYYCDEPDCEIPLEGMDFVHGVCPAHRS